MEGVKVSDITAETGYDLEQVARNVIEAAFRQLFEDGLFHGDPHPGNILVLPDNRIALLDFGLVGRLSRAQQEVLVTLLVAVALRDAETVARVLTRIGLPDAARPIAELREDIQRHPRPLPRARSSTRSGPPPCSRDLLDLAVRHRIRVPKEYATLGKAAMTIEGIIRRLHPHLDVLEVGLPYAKELLLARFNPGDASDLLMRSLLKLQALAEDVPTQLSQILQDLETGQVPGERRLRRRIDRLGGHVRALGMHGPARAARRCLHAGRLLVLAARGSALLGGAAARHRRGAALRRRGRLPPRQRPAAEDLDPALAAEVTAAGADRSRGANGGLRAGPSAARHRQGARPGPPPPPASAASAPSMSRGPSDHQRRRLAREAGGEAARRPCTADLHRQRRARRTASPPAGRRRGAPGTAG